MRSFLYGLIINLQFFSTIPLPVNVSMTNKHIERAVQTFPVLGLFQGAVSAGLLYSVLTWSPFSSLAVAFVVWLLLIVLSGGIHLDGWMDASDAYFSYRDPNKRREIMNDPRIGAFGVISVIVLLAARFLFIYEIVLMAIPMSYLLIVLIPFLGKVVMGLLLVHVPPAKADGMGKLFRRAAKHRTLWTYPFYIFLALASVLVWQRDALPFFIVMLVAALFLYVVLRKKSVQWFGGMTGDVAGASVEGVECLLWLVVWLFHHFAMG